MSLNRFMRKGISKFVFVPTISSPTLIPTAAEVTAGTDLTPEIAEVAGFMFENQPIETPDMGSSYVGKISGSDTVADSSLTFYEDQLTNPTYDVLDKGTVGYIVIFPEGIAGANPAAADVGDVWPVVVGSRTRVYTADNEAAKYRVVFNPTVEPVFDVAVAA